ncbi:MAG: bifunctional phosphopantothenoylcysteine decarboxylase/phosphopantothenate--cysteine ligase CoaBC [Thermoanaerobaculia bacterium]
MAAAVCSSAATVPSSSARPRVLLGVSGGIAAYKSADLVRRLSERGCEVRCAATRGARAFIQPLTLEVLSGHPVYGEEYLTATGSGEEAHIVAARWADLLCVAPATAHVVARLALGLADDFLTTTALVHQGPKVIAPAMHDAMWRQPSVQQHVDTLTRRGVHFVGPAEGPLASGEWGMGRMADPARIAGEVAALLIDRELEGKRVLVTAGPTHEPIDPVRFLGNRSSGKMGFALAAEAASRGAEVTLVAGPVSLPTPPGVTRVDVGTALEMRDAVYAAAPGTDLVVMTAAVADFRCASVAAGKLKRAQGLPALELIENPDILAGVPEVAPRAVVVGFAAETEASEDEARAKLERKGADFLVWNDVSKSDVGFGADDNEVKVYRRSGAPIAISRRPKREVAAGLIRLFLEAVKERERAVAEPVG